MNISFVEFKKLREVRLYIEDGIFEVHWKDKKSKVFWWNSYKLGEIVNLDKLEKLEYLEYLKEVLEVLED